MYFQVSSQPACPSSGPAVSYPGSPVVLRWRATGASQVSISIDGSGIYARYPSEGSAQFPFSCSGPSNSLQRHYYTIATIGDEPVQKRKLTVEARVS